ncbi:MULTISPECIES: hypothetical protein [Cupriavidus]|uniref:Uncharacterized protein n=1 Tax=Cupriavidus taiwanensis TaxID=164546 RepID=A0A375CTW2_9BURK|nr:MULTISPECIES: hypothetical protein [Cupriavidus]MEC3768445.1 hypothetical protein [Cupriavidus sp. SS-3]ULX53961.1 hypothetical protein A9P79_18685 [Cupriavidus taiwanensis]SOY80767.1 conserved hypothetical protein [Cupriavidus taiwanensis]SOY92074.1 conserved hypothetical protein [Cupriavidus taiwanensis]SPA49665.1 conserved hypothetical protein [Cupriavidus taiwanensis]
MGNSKRAAGCHLPAATPGYPVAGANGILAQVQGHHVAAALQTLPRATAEAPNHHEVLVEAGHLGTVRLFIVKKLARHNRHSHYYWSAYRAEPA